MARTWPSVIHRAQPSAALLGEVGLVALLAVTLALSWRDGAPSNDYVYPVGTTRSGIASLQVSGDNLYSGKPFLISRPPVAAPAPPPEAPIPSAPPVQLLIPALDVHRAVEEVGVDRRGVMNLPVNAWNAGWYNRGPVPGAPGDAVIEGHAGYPGKPLIFGRLGMLKPGDQVVVVLSDGSRQLFLVVSHQVVPAGSPPPGFAEPYGPPRLTLITCTSNFDKINYSYSARLVVELSYAGPV